jgi:hypothetical protein
MNLPEQLAERARDALAKAAGMPADYSVESLAAVDHYIEQLAPPRPEALLELAGRVGCYFGEVLRRAFGGAWTVGEDGDPRGFLLTLEAAPISLSPVAMTAEAIIHSEVEGCDATLSVPDALADTLERALDAMGELDEDTYYSLTGRFETIEHLVEVLAAARKQSNN